MFYNNVTLYCKVFNLVEKLYKKCIQDQAEQTEKIKQTVSITVQNVG